MKTVGTWLEHPLTRGASVDDPATTWARREIVRTKPFLRRLYRDWYDLITANVPAGAGAVVELGSGAGFLGEVLPETVASDVLSCPDLDVVLDAHALPFRERSLRALVFVNVLHHLGDCRTFFAEAARCVRPGGAIVAVEPWVSAWSSFVYRHLHHEPFCPSTPEWAFPSSGPLSSANGALPWIVLARDHALFARDFPQWRAARVRPLMPFRYLASGGVGLRSLAPGWAYPVVAGAERLLEPWMPALAMFAFIVLERTNVDST